MPVPLSDNHVRSEKGKESLVVVVVVVMVMVHVVGFVRKFQSGNVLPDDATESNLWIQYDVSRANLRLPLLPDAFDLLNVCLMMEMKQLQPHHPSYC